MLWSIRLPRNRLHAESVKLLSSLKGMSLSSISGSSPLCVTDVYKLPNSSSKVIFGDVPRTRNCFEISMREKKRWRSTYSLTGHIEEDNWAAADRSHCLVWSTSAHWISNVMKLMNWSHRQHVKFSEVVLWILWDSIAARSTIEKVTNPLFVKIFVGLHRSDALQLQTSSVVKCAVTVTCIRIMEYSCQY